MKSKPLFLFALGAAALLGWLAVPDRSSGQADTDDRTLNTLLAEVTAQQTVISENHAKIDEKIAAIAEEVRVARIFVGRGGGKTPAK